ncbi:MAG: methylenetetrahydrofolate--tRNA-(uracil(54)-C(5))-methyltransferase (FADH(2)-oxidizing) TrmFO [Clostridia bacterium]|nr:methylenetetrahydrofolate--tRNA-(uracil(54)-C(5))-methyltransferase (FADH(2)-oxidizing) TrmFO [Clostridia bacterium]
MVINVIGGGLAGSEACYYLAKKGYNVRLFDIKPDKFTPAHCNVNYGELVCSNSLKSSDVYGNACGLLKQELLDLGSFVLRVALLTKVPAGNALAVDREEFARKITEGLKSFPNVEFICKDVTEINFDEPTIIATGPLTTEGLSDFIRKNFSDGLYFYDAEAPIIAGDSIDFSEAFICDRYGEVGSGDYVNCPIDKEGYTAFYEALITAGRATKHAFENEDVKVFEGCMPVEVMAERGFDTLRFGPLKPAGLTDPRTGRWPYACMQLRKENESGTMYNIVGFQTNLLWGEQKRVFSMFPALKNAEFLRYGVMHRNTYIYAPAVLDKDFSVKAHPLCYFAGQITGVEGYVESIGSGLIAAISLDRKLKNKPAVDFTDTTVIGALAAYCSRENADFQPMNANYGILRPVADTRDKKLKKKLMGERSLAKIKEISEIINE